MPLKSKQTYRSAQSGNSQYTAMQKSKSKKFLKCLHLFFSLVLMLSAVLIVIGTLCIKWELAPYMTFLNDYSSKPVLFLLIGSALLIAAALLGIISVIQEWSQGINTFMLFLVYMFISMVALAITAYVLSTSIDDTMHSKWEAEMSNYESNKYTVDNLQTELSCCGISNFTDWEKYLQYIPGSCCKSEAFCDISEISSLHLAGCFTSLRNIVEYYARVVLFVLIFVGIIEICCVITSIFLVCALRRQLSEKNNSRCGNRPSEQIQLPRLHNPLAQVTPTIPPTKLQNLKEHLEEPIYIRRPSERPIILAYKNPHENYLHRPPQHRFDSRRASLNINAPPRSHVYDASRYS